MAQFIITTPNERSVKCNLRFHRTTRKISMRYTPKGLSLTVPSGIASKDIQQFIEKNMDWIEETLEKVAEEKEKFHLQMPKDIMVGVKIPFLGEMYTLSESDVEQIDKVGKIIYLKKVNHQRVNRFFNDYAKKEIAPLYKKYCNKLGVYPSRVAFKKMKSRWGSCNSKGVVNLNIMLIFAPEVVAESVVVHELCHLVHLDHSPAFYALIDSVFPYRQSSDQWLAEHGTGVLTFF